MNALKSLFAIKRLVSLFVVFALLANAAAPAFAETQSTEIKKPTLTGWDVVKAGVFGAGAGAVISWLSGVGASTVFIGSLAIPGLVIPALVGAVVIGGIAYFIKKTTDGVKEGILDPYSEELQKARQAQEQQGGLLGQPMDASGTGNR